MTHASCPDCGLRFTKAFVAVTQSCPMCCEPLHLDATAQDVFGQQLYFESAASSLEFPRPEDGR